MQLNTTPNANPDTTPHASRPIDALPAGTLIAVAAPAEVAAVLGTDATAPLATPIDHPSRAGVAVVRTGVGPAAAASAVAAVLARGSFDAVVSLGIAGSLPGPQTPGPKSPDLRTLVVADRCVLADQGVATPGSFTPTADMGFGAFSDHRDDADANPLLLDLLRPHAARVGPIATVSTCSGTDALAAAVAGRTGAIAEAMEGAAVALAAARAGLPFAECRVISNTTGDRDAQVWDLRGALDRLAALFGPAQTA